MKLRLRAPGVALTSALLVAGLVTGSASAAPSGRATLTGSIPSWASSANFKQASDTTASVGFRVYLGWTDETGAANLALAVSSPRSASYRQYLSPAQFRQQFAPSQSSVGAVQSWLRSQGFTVDYTPQNNHYVAAEGTVAQAAAAFGTTFNDYSYQGVVLRSPASDLSIPSSLAGIVNGVVGLDDGMRLVHTDHVVDAPPPAAFVNAPPCSSYWGELSTATTNGADGTVIPQAYGASQPWVPCGYTPSQLLGAYGLSGLGYDGTGVTVAVIDAYASPTIVSDVNTYSSRHGIPQFTGGQFQQVVAPGTFRRPQNPKQDPQGWSGEETLDIEAVHGMAPGASIVYVGAPNNYQDLDAAMNHVVDRHLADIVTNSYGFAGEALPPGFVKPFNDTLIQAAAEGIGVYFSSGDNGDETNGVAANFPFAQPDWPASSPWVTAVGGTSLGVSQSNGYDFETGWETTTSRLVSGNWSPTPPGSWLYGGGGGTSFLFAQPSYQAGVVPSSMATANGARSQAMRVVPDVAAVGDPQTGLLIGQTQTFPDGTTAYSEYRIGGTSLSSPLFAGIMALADQAAGAHHGFANPALYGLGSAAFHDVVPATSPVAVVRANFVNSVDASNGYSYFLRTTDFGGLTIHTAPGYDDVTGLGSVAGSAFIDALK